LVTIILQGNHRLNALLPIACGSCE